MSKLVDRYQMTESECELSSRRALSASTQVSCQPWCHQQLGPCWQFCHQGLDHVDKDHVVNRNWWKWSIKSGLFQALRGYSVPGTYQNSEDIQGGKVDLLRMEKVSFVMVIAVMQTLLADMTIVLLQVNAIAVSHRPSPPSQAHQITWEANTTVVTPEPLWW